MRERKRGKKRGKGEVTLNKEDRKEMLNRRKTREGKDKTEKGRRERMMKGRNQRKGRGQDK